MTNWILRKASVEVWDSCELIKNICLYISGLTSSNYSELSHLYEKYKTQGMFHLGKFLLILFNNSFFSTKMGIRLNLYISEILWIVLPITSVKTVLFSCYTSHLFFGWSGWTLESGGNSCCVCRIWDSSFPLQSVWGPRAWIKPGNQAVCLYKV